MGSNISEKDFCIEVNDIFDELMDKNTKLLKELNFANIPLNVLLKYKTLLKRIYEKYDQIIDSEDKEEFNCLNEELNSVIIRVDKSIEQNVCIKTEELNIFEIRDNNNKSNEETVMSTENIDIINEMVVKQSFEINSKTKRQSNDVYPHINGNRNCGTVNNEQDKSTGNNNMTTITKVFQCESCDQTFATLLQLNDHKCNHSDHNIVTILAETKNSHAHIIESQRNCVSKQLNDESIDKNIEHLDSDTEVSDSNDYSEKETSDKNKRRFVCSYERCDQTFKFKSNLEIHIRRKHTFEKPFKCEECVNSFIIKYDLKQHKLEHLGQTFKCKECHKLFKRQKILTKHMKTVHTSIRFLCDLCGLQVKCKTSLDKHILYKHRIKDKTVECDYEDCHKKFIDVYKMSMHKRRFHTTKRFECHFPKCRKIFKYKYSLDQHKQIHLGLPNTNVMSSGVERHSFVQKICVHIRHVI